MIEEAIKRTETSPVKVIGIGGGGSNAVARLFNQQPEGVDFCICNTDSDSLQGNPVVNKIQLGPKLTEGLGSGCKPHVGRDACLESLDAVKHFLSDGTRLVLLTTGLGGGTGTGATPVISNLCKEMGIITICIVTIPAVFEGKKRVKQAKEAVLKLKKSVDTLVVIELDKLRKKKDNTSYKDLFVHADEILLVAVKCLTDIINSTGQINVDFTDLLTVVKNGGHGIMGYGMAAGDYRAVKAIQASIDQLFLTNLHLREAKNVLININSAAGNAEFTMDEVEIISQYLFGLLGEGADVIMGLGYDDTLGNHLKVSIIITGILDPNQDPIEESTELPNKEIAPDKRDETTALRLKLKLPAGMPKRVTQAILMPAFILTMQTLFKFLFNVQNIGFGISLASVSLAQLFPYLFYDNLILLKVYRLHTVFEEEESRLITKHYFSIAKEAKEIARIKSWTLILFIVVLAMFLITLGLAYRPEYYSIHTLTGIFCVLMSILYLILV
ncbi:MAG: cell division protein FtsZ [Candidatus Pseudobacter hemicellulosilyticus]|uniref:Cell division protein FtsZ n=1 Tax=Candidatus Pseudobacter hemicellulosilyticus TaxID=3121375 RepID=A0AAJ5WU60_9BACT|nr:MAG: cell division protein FtsZ [Pseudobacter sp.]